MNRRTILLAITALITVTASFAQKPAATGAIKRTIEVLIGGVAKGDTIYLANYYGNKLYYTDTAKADGKGNVVFKSPKGYEAGVYAVVVPGPKYFEMIVNEPVIKLTTTKADLLGTLQVKQSKENELFIGYIRYLNVQKLRGDALKARLDVAKDEEARLAVREEMKQLDVDVKKYQRDLVANNPGTLAASLVKMSMVVELPPAHKPDGSVDSAAAYYNYRAHYWDNFDLTDRRIVRVPVFANKFDEYIAKVVPQVPDTIDRLADELIARTDTCLDVFKYMVHNITNKFESSDIMGMDAVFVHMAQTYYCPDHGRTTRVNWMDADKMVKLCERAHKMAPLVLGKKAPYLALTDTTEEKWINFYDLPAEYVVIIFLSLIHISEPTRPY